jgi:hypothetical protein
MRPLTDRKFEASSERLARGKYLTEAVMGCFYCHSQRDCNSNGAPAIAATKGGGSPFDTQGFPGKVYASNITPDPETGVGNWTDDMLARAIREGVDKDGRTLLPMMP